MLDASALMCLINDELGAARVAAVLPRASLSAVNLAEIAAKLNDLGADAEAARAPIAPLHLTVMPLDEGTALAAGALRVAIRGYGLRSATALTTDRAWRDAGEVVGVTVEIYGKRVTLRKAAPQTTHQGASTHPAKDNAITIPKNTIRL